MRQRMHAMKLNKKKVITLVILIPMLLYFWPTQLYGNTSYVMLLGDSMKPTIESGTLIIVMAEAEYLLGDTIAFVNEDGINLVHRIMDKTEEGFVTKGDNNPKNDREIITDDKVLGRAVFVIPYLGYTSLFLKTPLGVAILGIWAVVMLVPKRKQKKSGESLAIFKIALAANTANFLVTQVVLGDNINSSKLMSIPLSNVFEPFMASTIYFALMTVVIIMLLFVAKHAQNEEKKSGPLKIIFIAGGMMILVIQLMNIINILPLFINIVTDHFSFLGTI